MTKPIRVVIAEDEAIIRLDLKESLEAEGYAVIGETGRGDEAIDLVRMLEPDLVILDLQIGNMGGVAASLDLRHEITAGRLKPLKIILLLDREADTWIATEAKADSELVKPLNALRLRKLAKSLL